MSHPTDALPACAAEASEAAEERHITHRCRGCRNECQLDVLMRGGKVVSAEGGGCRRAIVNAKKYLEKQ